MAHFHTPSAQSGALLPAWKAWIDRMERFVPAQCGRCEESIRRARLITSFSFLGTFFGAAFAGFYSAIGHWWGAGIVGLCSGGFVFVPWLMRRTNSVLTGANLLCLLMTLGFSALCCVEGGANGHALAWLAGIPLTALLLVGRGPALIWAAVSLLMTGVLVGFSVAHVELPATFDERWVPTVSAAGYVSLVAFMFALGMIFETGRARAFGRMQEALKRLEEANGELVRLNQEKNEFLGIAAHDLKNPLTAIIGSADLIQRAAGGGICERLASNIMRSGSRMLELIKELLDANAIERGAAISEMGEHDLSELARESVEQNAEAAGRKQIVLRFESDAVNIAKLGKRETTQILDNLISNALKFSSCKSGVTVRAYGEPHCGMACVSVTDHGPGVSEEDKKRMFGKFTRLSAKPTNGESSTGLGLSIVKRLAEVMNGTVECQSVLGCGATFTLRLPACGPQNSAGSSVEHEAGVCA